MRACIVLIAVSSPCRLLLLTTSASLLSPTHGEAAEDRPRARGRTRTGAQASSDTATGSRQAAFPHRSCPVDLRLEQGRSALIERNTASHEYARNPNPTRSSQDGRQALRDRYNLPSRPRSGISAAPESQNAPSSSRRIRLHPLRGQGEESQAKAAGDDEQRASGELSSNSAETNLRADLSAARPTSCKRCLVTMPPTQLLLPATTLVTFLACCKPAFSASGRQSFRTVLDDRTMEVKFFAPCLRS